MLSETLCDGKQLIRWVDGGNGGVGAYFASNMSPMLLLFVVYLDTNKWFFVAQMDEEFFATIDPWLKGFSMVDG